MLWHQEQQRCWMPSPKGHKEMCKGMAMVPTLTQKRASSVQKRMSHAVIMSTPAPMQAPAQPSQASGPCFEYMNGQECQTDIRAEAQGTTQKDPQQCSRESSQHAARQKNISSVTMKLRNNHAELPNYSKIFASGYKQKDGVLQWTHHTPEQITRRCSGE